MFVGSSRLSGYIPDHCVVATSAVTSGSVVGSYLESGVRSDRGDGVVHGRIPRDGKAAAALEAESLLVAAFGKVAAYMAAEMRVRAVRCRGPGEPALAVEIGVIPGDRAGRGLVSDGKPIQRVRMAQVAADRAARGVVHACNAVLDIAVAVVAIDEAVLQGKRVDATSEIRSAAPGSVPYRVANDVHLVGASVDADAEGRAGVDEVVRDETPRCGSSRVDAVIHSAVADEIASPDLTSYGRREEHPIADRSCCHCSKHSVEPTVSYPVLPPGPGARYGRVEAGRSGCPRKTDVLYLDVAGTGSHGDSDRRSRTGRSCSVHLEIADGHVGRGPGQVDERGRGATLQKDARIAVAVHEDIRPTDGDGREEVGAGREVERSAASARHGGHCGSNGRGVVRHPISDGSIVLDVVDLFELGLDVACRAAGAGSLVPGVGATETGLKRLEGPVYMRRGEVVLGAWGDEEDLIGVDGPAGDVIVGADGVAARVGKDEPQVL